MAALCARFGQRLDEVGDAAAIKLWSTSGADLTDLVRELETQRRRLEALQAVAVAEAGRRDLAKAAGAISTTAWLAGLLTIERRAASAVDKLGAALDHGLQATVAAFGAGAVDAAQARVIAAAVAALPDSLGAETIGKGEALMLAWAAEHPANVLASLGAHLLAHLAPEVADAAEAERLARADARDEHRRNTLRADLDARGRVRVRGEFDPESWAVVAAALEPFAKPQPANRADGASERDLRTVGQRQADALVELCRRVLSAYDIVDLARVPSPRRGHHRLRDAAG